MSKTTFKQIAVLITFSILLVVAIVKIDWFFSVLGTIIGLLTPLIIGLIIAFILHRPYNLFRKLFCRLFKKDDESKLTKGFGLVITYLLLLIILALIILLIVPQVYNSIRSLVINFESYLENFKSFLTTIEDTFGISTSLYDSISEYYNSLIERFSTEDGLANLFSAISGIFPHLIDLTKNVVFAIVYAFIGFAMSIYIMLSKETLIRQIKGFTFAHCRLERAEKLSRTGKMISRTFDDYIVGRIIDAVVVGVLCYIGMSIFGFAYAPLISCFMGITNLIPILGPYIGGIPSTFILLVIDPKQALFFVIFILVLQQVDGNFIEPKIMGDSIGLPALWVMVSVFVGGGLFGILGMVLGVPVTAVVYNIVRENTLRKIRNKNLASRIFNFNREKKSDESKESADKKNNSSGGKNE